MKMKTFTQHLEQCQIIFKKLALTSIKIIYFIDAVIYILAKLICSWSYVEGLFTQKITITTFLRTTSGKNIFHVKRFLCSSRSPFILMNTHSRKIIVNHLENINLSDLVTTRIDSVVLL